MAGDDGYFPSGGPVARMRLPSIAVLPFFCFPHGTVDREFGEGVAFSITAGLMTFADLNVISAAATMHYWHAAPKALEIAGQLGVRYLLLGQIAQADEMLTFSFRLLDVEVGSETAFDPIEVHISSLHNVELFIVTPVIRAIMPRMREAEVRKALAATAPSRTAHQTLLRAIAALHHLTPESHDRAERLLCEAQALDPSFGAAFAWHARLVSMRIGQGWVADRRQACLEALRLARHAIALDPNNAVALATAGHLHSYLLKDYDTALELLQRAVVACPNEPYAWLKLATTLAYLGRGEEARECSLHALSLSPSGPNSSLFNSFIAICHFAAGDCEGAARYARMSLERSPNYATTWRVLAVALVGLGHVEAAREAGARVVALEPGYPNYAEEMAPFSDPVLREVYLSHLETAGVIKRSKRMPS
jgi:adenylate cyclase